MRGIFWTRLFGETRQGVEFVMGSDGFLPVVVVHGGAWNIPDHLRELSLEGVQHAAEAAVASLRRDPSSALDAVEAAVRVLEDDPVFDAGIGSCLTEDRDVEMDSIIMCGQTLNTGKSTERTLGDRTVNSIL